MTRGQAKKVPAAAIVHVYQNWKRAAYRERCHAWSCLFSQ